MSIFLAKVLFVLTLTNPLTSISQMVYKYVNVQLPSQETHEVVLQTEVDNSSNNPQITVTPQPISTPESAEVAGDVTKSTQKVVVKAGETTLVVPMTGPSVPDQTIDATTPELSKPVIQTDICKNIEGVQTKVPSGMIADEDNCTTKPAVSEPVVEEELEPVVVADTTAPYVGIFNIDQGTREDGTKIAWYQLNVNEELSSYDFNLSHSQTKFEITPERWCTNPRTVCTRYVYTGSAEPFEGTESLSLIVTDLAGNKKTVSLSSTLVPYPTFHSSGH